VPKKTPSNLPLFKKKCQDEAKGDFFRKPPAYRRLPFMPPFAGDIGAGPGSLKRIAQIPRKAYR
jgi:hypothetical protein